MLTIEGTYKNGQVALSKLPSDIGEAKVLVTFLQTSEIDLRAKGISEEQAAILRSKLSVMSDDWNRPEMDVYDVD